MQQQADYNKNQVLVIGFPSYFIEYGRSDQMKGATRRQLSVPNRVPIYRHRNGRVKKQSATNGRLWNNSARRFYLMTLQYQVFQQVLEYFSLSSEPAKCLCVLTTLLFEHVVSPTESIKRRSVVHVLQQQTSEMPISVSTLEAKSYDAFIIVQLSNSYDM